MSEPEHYVVVEDPNHEHDGRGEYWEGGVVDAARMKALAGRGVILLPVAPDLFRASAVGGYMRRGWGSGWPMPKTSPQSFCPLMQYVTPECKSIFWAARIVRDSRSKETPRGLLRLVSDSIQVHAVSAGYSPDPTLAVARFEDLGEPDALGGWVVRGRGKVSPTTSGHLGLALYGFATSEGLRVAWAAVSSAP